MSRESPSEEGGRRLLKPELAYYAIEASFTAAPAFVASVYVVFLLSRGLNFKGVALVDGFFIASMALLDFPTGGLADRFGRKPITALGTLFVGLGLVSYSLSDRLPEFLLSEFLVAVGGALYSGALEAWMFDKLKEEHRQADAPRIFGNAGTLGWLASMVAAFLGGLVAQHAMSLSFLAGALPAFLGTVLVLLLVKEDVTSRESEQVPYRQYLERGLRVMRGSSALKWLTAALAFGMLANPSFTLTWAPQMQALGADKWLLGLAGSVLMGTVGISQFVGGRLAQKLGNKRSSLLGAALSALSFPLLVLAWSPAAFLALALPFEVGLGFRRPAVASWYNELIPSEERATTLSLRSTLLRFVGLLGMVVMGCLSDVGTPRLAYLWGFIAYLPGLALLAMVPGEKRSQEDD